MSEEITVDTIPTEDELLAQAQEISFGTAPKATPPPPAQDASSKGAGDRDAKTTTPPASGEAPAPSAEPQPAAAANPDEAAAPKPGDAQSDFAKRRDERKAKEKERNDRSWARLHEEREAFAREREQFAREREAGPTARKPESVPPDLLKDEHGHTVADYEALAKDCRRDGDESLARIAESRAAKLREKQQEAPRPSKDSPAASADAELARTLEAESAALMREDPALADPQNPVVKRSLALFNDPQVGRLFRQPGGIRASVEVAKLQEAAARVPALEKQLAERDAELTRLRKATAIPGGPPGSPGKPPKSFEAMSFEEQEAVLREQAKTLT